MRSAVLGEERSRRVMPSPSKAFSPAHAARTRVVLVDLVDRPNRTTSEHFSGLQQCRKRHNAQAITVLS